MSHTPGPWETCEIAGNGANIPARMEIVAPEGEWAKKLIANIYGFSLPTGRANARLIAAAPELYEALRDLFEAVIMSEKISIEAGFKARVRARDILLKLREEGEENA